MQTVSDGLILRERMRDAQSVLVLTGAGVWAESGVPTFRGGGNTAVWKGMPFDVISSAGMLQRDLPAVWEWFNYRRNLLASLKPNAAHRTIARWQDDFSDLALVTQNIDGLHQAAGSRDVIELHGNIWRARCSDCEGRYSLNELAIDEGVPRCFDCGGNLRPDVVLFGEMLPLGAFERAADAAQRCDVCFVVGTSAVVYPAASIPEIARANGAYIVEVNPERTPLSSFCDQVLTGKAGEIMPMLLDEVSTGSGSDRVAAQN
ncbi:MAG TPA: NAD-dependent deacylase [Pyrinomonadaceae bacterium]|jgi:NAD-dependent deacetylase|nr:NAD-dependent deacylase [Pyrinomonadaceae bacterium]